MPHPPDALPYSHVIVSVAPHGHTLTHHASLVGWEPEPFLQMVVEMSRYGNLFGQFIDYCVNAVLDRVLLDQPRPVSQSVAQRLEMALYAWLIAFREQTQRMRLLDESGFLPYRLHSLRGARNDTMVLYWHAFEPALV